MQSLNESEQLFAQAAVEQELATKEQIQRCVEIKNLLDSAGKEAPTLDVLLVRKEILTEQQAQEILEQIEVPRSGSRVTSEENEKGAVIGGYSILKKISKGAMGTVYKARQLSMDRIVAIKILSKRLSRDLDFVKRFASLSDHRHCSSSR